MSTPQDPPRDPMARPARLMKRYEPILAILLAAAMITAAILAPWLRFVLTIALAKGIAVLGILLLLRAGQVSFGHAIYIAFGAYVVAFLAPTVNDAVALLGLAALGAGLLGLIGAFVTRYRQIFFHAEPGDVDGVLFAAGEALRPDQGQRHYPLEMSIAGQMLDRVTMNG